MRKRKNIIFLIISSFWFLSLLFLAPVSAEESHATGTQTISAGEMENAGINFLTKFLPWEKIRHKLMFFIMVKKLYYQRDDWI